MHFKTQPGLSEPLQTPFGNTLAHILLCYFYYGLAILKSYIYKINNKKLTTNGSEAHWLQRCCSKSWNRVIFGLFFNYIYHYHYYSSPQTAHQIHRTVKFTHPKNRHPLASSGEERKMKKKKKKKNKWGKAEVCVRVCLSVWWMPFVLPSFSGVKRSRPSEKKK